MADFMQFEATSHSGDETSRLAQWLQQILKTIPQAERAPTAEQQDELELLFDGDYHLRFYQQLPDFIMALLENDGRATLHYAPLLFHLAGCSECHNAYLDLYDAMRAAVHPREPRPMLGQGTRTLGATPPRMLKHLCQVLISQAEAVLLQARHDRINENDAARSLLQLAMRISAHITQSNVRHQALHDLVRVATLFDGAHADPAAAGRSIYTPSLVTGKRTVRRTETPACLPEMAQEQQAIHLQARSLAGKITQRENTLELHLSNLDETLRGQYVFLSVPLGGLLEPVRWLGGNPRAIRSTTSVDASGALTTPLGETELRLSNAEERNLLEVMFLRLEVRTANQAG